MSASVWWQLRKRGCWPAEPETWNKATEVRTVNLVQYGSGRPYPYMSPVRGPQGLGLRPNVVTAAWPCGKADRARAHRSLGCDAVAPAALHTIGLRRLGRRAELGVPTLQRASRAALCRLGRFYPSPPCRAKFLADCAACGPAFPFGRPQNGGRGGGATFRARGALSPLLRRPGLSREPRSSAGTCTRRT